MVSRLGITQASSNFKLHSVMTSKPAKGLFASNQRQKEQTEKASSDFKEILEYVQNRFKPVKT